MKRAILVLLLTATCLLLGCSNEKSVVGKWIDDETEAVIEYTDDGYYYEYVNEGFTTDKTRYNVKNGKITYYIDGEAEETGFEVEYEIDKEGNLIINGEIKYRPMLSQEERE